MRCVLFGYVWGTGRKAGEAVDNLLTEWTPRVIHNVSPDCAPAFPRVFLSYKATGNPIQLLSVRKRFM